MGRIDSCVQAFRKAIRPPSRLSLSEWADQYAVLSAESSAEAGRWRTLPYQKGIMDAITDPAIERVSVKKSARVGYTKILNHTIGYYIHQDPCSLMLVQPTVEDAEGYSKEEIAPMLRDTPILQGRVTDARTKDGTNSILHKLFDGGQFDSVGANSPRGFRRKSRRVVLFDETSAYPRSAGSEGSPIKLGIKRSEYFWNRKIVDGSTPGIDGACAISEAFLQGDQRRRFVPCPHCGYMQYLKFENLKWPAGKPDQAYMQCEGAGCEIQHKHLRWMDECGEWRPTAVAKNRKHVSFHVWAGYSYSPNSTWADIAAEYESCEHDTNLLKTFFNTVLGETWTEVGEVPDYKRLYERREVWPVNSLQPGIVFLTAGADVQKDRIEVEIVGWGRDKQSWSVDYRVIMGETASEAPWKKLDKLLNETWVTTAGNQIQLRMLAIDCGYNTQYVYNWVAKKPTDRVRAVKGSDSLQMIFGTPRDVTFARDGSKLARASKYWPVGVSVVKSEVYGCLNLDGAGDDEIYPPGFCHFPQYDEEHFRRLCAEQLVHKLVNGRTVTHWVKSHERNEQLDCRVYARAAAAMFGMDRLTDKEWNILQGKHDLPPDNISRKVENSAPTAPETNSMVKNDFWARQTRPNKKLW